MALRYKGRQAGSGGGGGAAAVAEKGLRVVRRAGAAQAEEFDVERGAGMGVGSDARA